MMLITRRELPRSADADRLEHALRARGLLACELELGPLTPDAVAALARDAARLSERDVDAGGRARRGQRAAGGRDGARARPRARGGRAEPARLGARDARAAVRRGARAGRARRGRGAADRGRSSSASSGSTIPTRRRDGRARDRAAAAPPATAIGFRHALLRDAVYEEIAEPRRRGLHQRWARGAARERAGGRDPAPGRGRAAAAARRRRAEAVPQLVRAAADARARRGARAGGRVPRGGARDRAGSRRTLWLELGELEAWRGRREQAEAGVRTGAGAARAGASRSCSRAPGCGGRAPTTGRSASRGPCSRAPRTRSSCSTGAERPAAEERSEALAAWAWAEAVAGSVDEAERLLARARAPTPAAATTCATYDVGHARALALMRRGRFVESYGPSIAAGEAIARAGRPDLAYGCWANAAGAATRGRASTSARSSSSTAASARSPATAAEPRDSAARRAVVRAARRWAAGGGACARPRPSRRWPSSSGSPS